MPSLVTHVACPKSRETFWAHGCPCCDPLLRVQHERSGKPEDCRTQRPDAQKVDRLFGQAIWTTKNDIGFIFDVFLTGIRRAFPNTSDQLLEMCPMTRGQATPIVMTKSDLCWPG